MDNRIQKLIRLANNTGDRLIVFDQDNPEDAFVLMSTPEYEKIAKTTKNIKSLTEEELLDKINREIASWKDAQDVDSQRIEDVTMINENPISRDSNHRDFTKSNEDIGLKTEDKKIPNKWNIPGNRKKAADEIIEEDRQYIITEEE